nr:hypothetical protein [Candidatus Sigynarchaeota archaeon]
GNYRRLVKIEGDEYLQAALAKGKGVIMTSLHIGQFFHEVGGLVLDPRGYELVVVANMKNQMIFENLMQIPQYKRLRVVGSASFKQIKEKLANYLKMNKIVFLMHDIAGAHNLKVPFLPGEKDFLVNLPQGAIALHKATGAPILPVLTIPDGRFTKSTLKFFDPAPILAASERHRNAPDKEFHGYLSIEINMIMFPYLVNYLHCWEEIVTMGTRTFDIKLRFEKGAGFDQIVGSMRAWALAQIEGSFEPGRKDEELRAWLIQSMDSVQSAAKKEESGKQPFALQCKACINLGGLGTCDQLKKIYKVLASLASRASLASTARSVRAMIPAIDEYYHTVVE